MASLQKKLETATHDNEQLRSQLRADVATVREELAASRAGREEADRALAAAQKQAAERDTKLGVVQRDLERLR